LSAAALGTMWLARGRVRTALRWFREAAAMLRDEDAVRMLPWALAGLAQAAAQAGEPAVARAAVAELAGRRLGHKGFEVELGLAHAWSVAAEGELSRACALARAAAELAEDRGQDALALRAHHKRCRLGDPAGATPALARLAGTSGEPAAGPADGPPAGGVPAGAVGGAPAGPADGPPAGAVPAGPVEGAFAAAAAAHAEALAQRDGRALLQVAEQFAAQDALLVAAEAAAAAAAAFRAEGREASARAAAARAAVLLQACEGARSPALPGAPTTAELTRREREVALLAAGGLSSREIAGRLVVSVRTVDDHLQRAYRKLGVAGRGELARVLHT
jgi:DNA-binding CsgD family transcriptional regulator